MRISQINTNRFNQNNSSKSTPDFQARMLKLPSGKYIDAANVLEVLPGKVEGTTILRVLRKKNVKEGKRSNRLSYAVDVVKRITIKKGTKNVANNVSYAKTIAGDGDAIDIMANYMQEAC